MLISYLLRGWYVGIILRGMFLFHPLLTSLLTVCQGRALRLVQRLWRVVIQGGVRDADVAGHLGVGEVRPGQINAG